MTVIEYNGQIPVSGTAKFSLNNHKNIMNNCSK